MTDLTEKQKGAAKTARAHGKGAIPIVPVERLKKPDWIRVKAGNSAARFGEVKLEAAPRRRTAGLVAVGLDRLVVPMAEAERNQETRLHVAAQHGGA